MTLEINANETRKRFFSKFKRGNGKYSQGIFEKAIHEYMDEMNEKIAKERANREEHYPAISKTHAGVTLIGLDFYVRFGATDWEMKYGFEQHAINADDIYIQAKAVQRLIILLSDNIKDKHT